MRINSGPLKRALEAEVRAADAKGVFSKAPESLGEKSVTELLDDGTIELKIDRKFPQAMGIDRIKRHVALYGNSSWEILINKEADINPLFTSDYPVAIEVINIHTPINRVVVLAPDLAVRIKPDMQLRGKELDSSFPENRAIQRPLKRTELVTINRLIVQCAEDFVFFRDDLDWVKGFVSKNARYRVEPTTVGGTATQRILLRASEVG
jgi:hypothetical protein